MSGNGVIYCHSVHTEDFAVRAGSAVMGSGAASWNVHRHKWIVFKPGLSITADIITTLGHKFRWEGSKTEQLPG
jgi:hypothetical protein